MCPAYISVNHFDTYIYIKATLNSKLYIVYTVSHTVKAIFKPQLV